MFFKVNSNILNIFDTIMNAIINIFDRWLFWDNFFLFLQENLIFSDPAKLSYFVLIF